jgi:hypothetical protein
MAAMLRVTKGARHPLRGMLSPEEIKSWVDSIAAESTLKLIELCHKPAKPVGRAVTQIVSEMVATNTEFGFSVNSTSSTLMPSTKVYRPIASFSEDPSRDVHSNAFPGF